MSFYSQWYEQNVCLRGSPSKNTMDSPIRPTLSRIGSFEPVQADLTAAHVTVSSVKNKLIYNIEYKQSEGSIKSPSHSKQSSTVGGIHTRESSVSSTKLKTSAPHVGATACSVVARFQNSNHSRRHSRQGSSISENLISSGQISPNSLWDDWIVKYINEDKKSVAVEDDTMDDWIFERM
ncbi:24452_t:CDS:2 [Dentiscutata erythropus]|uniref:24452_t:CDS:1 n=1 Tax=Dentiscutata erythropus TaxID=1348616 RepID=A0A9N9AM92_9GLOM|nr:24452_t:CDS:2 [Dentiscutata erythropus]